MPQRDRGGVGTRADRRLEDQRAGARAGVLRGDGDHAARNRDTRHVLRGRRRATRIAEVDASQPARRMRGQVFRHRRLAGGGRSLAFRHLRADHVVLISRQGNRCQDADDGYDDHQFDEREALLNAFHRFASWSVVMERGFSSSATRRRERSGNANGWIARSLAEATAWTGAPREELRVDVLGYPRNADGTCFAWQPPAYVPCHSVIVAVSVPVP